jgi:hypothetical protein
MTTTHPNGEGTVEEERPEPSPEYLALPKSEREAIDQLVSSTQEMQNHVDRSIGIMGEPVFFMAGLILGQELRIRTMKRQMLDLQSRLTELEDRVS